MIKTERENVKVRERKKRTRGGREGERRKIDRQREIDKERQRENERGERERARLGVTEHR